MSEMKITDKMLRKLADGREYRRMTMQVRASENDDEMTPIYKDSNTDNEKPNVSLLKYPINTLQCYNKETKKCN